MVEYANGGQANHPEYKGYISWSPKAVFEKAYMPTAGMSFGFAIEAARAGKKIARAGWNGKDMWLSISHNVPTEVPAENFWSPNNRDYAEKNGGSAVVLPSFTMKTASGEILMGWLASQSDMLAMDWMIV